MNFTSLRYFLAVAEEKNITHAAEKLFISQQALSGHIRKLEEEIGTPIFKRTNSGVDLTYFGSHFIDNASEILMRLNLLEEYCNRQTKLQPLQLSVISGGYLFLNRRFSDLFIKYMSGPVEFRYLEGNGKRQIDLLRRGEVELGFSSMWSYDKKAALRRFNSNGIEYHSLMDAVPGIYVDRDNPLFPESVDIVDVEMLKGLPFITTSMNREGTDVMFRILFPNDDLENIFPDTHLIYTESSGAMRDFLRYTGGFALGSYCDTMYETEGFYSSLRFIPFPPGLLHCEVGWLQCNNTVRSPLADELIETLRSSII